MLEHRLRAVPLNVFPTLGSLEEVLDFAETKLPITNRNDINVLLMVMQNTVLAQLQRTAA